MRALNFATLLTAYQAQLLNEMGHQLDSGTANLALWEEICWISLPFGQSAEVSGALACHGAFCGRGEGLSSLKEVE